MKFKNYIFDLGGVLLDINMQNALDGFRALGIPEQELRFDVGETARIMQNYQLGFLTTDEFCDAIIGRCKAGSTQDNCKNRPTRKQVADAWNSIILNIPQRKIDALHSLKQKANVFLLSNTNELHWQKCLDNWLRVDCFHHIFLSQEMHLEKPDPEIFKQAFREIAEITSCIPNAQNTVFLDDNQANVQAAIDCGISGIHVTPDYDWFSEL